MRNVFDAIPCFKYDFRPGKLHVVESKNKPGVYAILKAIDPKDIVVFKAPSKVINIDGLKNYPIGERLLDMLVAVSSTTVQGSAVIHERENTVSYTTLPISHPAIVNGHDLKWKSANRALSILNMFIPVVQNYNNLQTENLTLPMIGYLKFDVWKFETDVFTKLQEGALYDTTAVEVLDLEPLPTEFIHLYLDDLFKVGLLSKDSNTSTQKEQLLKRKRLLGY